MDQTLQDLGEYVAGRLPNDVLKAEIKLGELIITAHRGSIVKVLTFLRDDANCQFKQLMDLCGVDYPDRDERFEVVYNLLSPKLNQRVRVKVTTDEGTPV